MSSENFNHKQHLLILHGWGGSRQSWEQFIKLIDKNKYQVFAPDLPGFGGMADAASELMRNEFGEIKPWNVDAYAQHVKKIMSKYNIEDPICIAHSFGGRIAIKLAAADPRIFKQLFLVGAAGIKPKDSIKKCILKAIAGLGNLVLNWRLLAHFVPLQKLLKKVLYKIAGTSDYNQTAGVMRETFKNVIDEDLTPYLSRIKTKTHLIWGQKDSYVPIRDAKIMNASIENSTLDIIKDGRHGLHLQMPEKLWQIIQSYL